MWTCASTFILSSKDGNEAYVHPVLEGSRYRFIVKMGQPPAEAKDGTKLARGANFRCLLSDAPIASDYIKAEGCAGRMGARLMAIVAEGARGRVYLPPSEVMETSALQAEPDWKPELKISGSTQYLGVKPYGIERFSQLFTDRQLVSLTAFSDLVTEAREKILQDALVAGMPNDDIGLDANGTGAQAYAAAVSVYLAFVIDKASDYWSTVCSWHSSKQLIRNTFGRQAIPMVWDYAETNPFSDSAGNVSSGVAWAQKVLLALIRK
jgi:putative DNA methylase